MIEATTTCSNDASSSICFTVASGTPEVYNGYTKGELLISFFLLVLIIGAVFGFIVNKFLYKK
jgi:hypothetical protein